MKAILALEIIADNLYAAQRTSDQAKAKEERYSEMLGRDKIRPWVARLTGICPRYGFKREFLRGQKDYSQANSIGSRGVKEYFPLDPGIYEVHERLTWKRARCYFIRVQDAKIIEIDRGEVEQCLRNDI